MRQMAAQMEAMQQQLQLSLDKQAATEARLQAADTPPAEAQEAATLLIDLGQPARPIRLQFVALISARLRLPVVLDQLPVAPERIQGGYALSDPNGALSCHFVQGIECGAAGSLMK